MIMERVTLNLFIHEVQFTVPRERETNVREAGGALT